MKTIEEAAIDCALKDEFPNGYDAECAGFRAGVKFAEEWISVEDELPGNQDIVFIMTDKGCYGTGYLHGKKSGFVTYGEDAYKEFGNVTHWRPIHRNEHYNVY